MKPYRTPILYRFIMTAERAFDRYLDDDLSARRFAYAMTGVDRVETVNGRVVYRKAFSEAGNISD